MRAERAALAGAELDLRLGDLRDPPVDERVPLVIIPFRSLLHLRSDADRRKALRAVLRLLQPGGRFVFDVFAPARDDIEETNGRWIEREPGIYERADWDEQARTLDALRRGAERRSTMRSPGSTRTSGATCSRRGLRDRSVLRLVRPGPYPAERTGWVARAPA